MQSLMASTVTLVQQFPGWKSWFENGSLQKKRNKESIQRKLTRMMHFKKKNNTQIFKQQNFNICVFTVQDIIKCTSPRINLILIWLRDKNSLPVNNFVGKNIFVTYILSSQPSQTFYTRRNFLHFQATKFFPLSLSNLYKMAECLNETC